MFNGILIVVLYFTQIALCYGSLYHSHELTTAKYVFLGIFTLFLAIQLLAQFIYYQYWEYIMFNYDHPSDTYSGIYTDFDEESALVSKENTNHRRTQEEGIDNSYERRDRKMTTSTISSHSQDIRFSSVNEYFSDFAMSDDKDENPVNKKNRKQKSNNKSHGNSKTNSNNNNHSNSYSNNSTAVSNISSNGNSNNSSDNKYYTANSDASSNQLNGPDQKCKDEEYGERNSLVSESTVNTFFTAKQ